MIPTVIKIKWYWDKSYLNGWPFENTRCCKQKHYPMGTSFIRGSTTSDRLASYHGGWFAAVIKIYFLSQRNISARQFGYTLTNQLEECIDSICPMKNYFSLFGNHGRSAERILKTTRKNVSSLSNIIVHQMLKQWLSSPKDNCWQTFWDTKNFLFSFFTWALSDFLPPKPNGVIK